MERPSFLVKGMQDEARYLGVATQLVGGIGEKLWVATADVREDMFKEYVAKPLRRTRVFGRNRMRR